MTSNILTQSKSAFSIKTTTVYEYSFTVINPQDQDTQALTASFTSLPTIEDWQNWLSGWTSCGYCLASSPVLIWASCSYRPD